LLNEEIEKYLELFTTTCKVVSTVILLNGATDIHCQY
jgi:hypothetical protein